VFEDWIAWEAQDEECARVAEVLRELAGLGRLGETQVPWRDVEQVVVSRFELERRPLEPVEGGAIHVGALDAMAGLDFRVVMIPGLVEGGFPGTLHPDPFLLDDERATLNRALGGPLAGSAEVQATPPPRSTGQLSLFGQPEEPVASAPDQNAAPGTLATTQDRLVELRRVFHRALSQATERLYLSYPRADPRSGRERLPSLFLVVAASTLEGRVLGAEALSDLLVEDDLERLSPDEALDRGERDRIRVLHDPETAVEAIASGSAFFRQSRLAAQARWQRRLTAYDGLIAPLPPDLATKLDPVSSGGAVSATRLSTFMRCGFLYLLQYVLRLEPTLEPEERRRLEPLERGNAFHEAAERFLRERREAGALPLKDTPQERERLLAIGDAALDALVHGSPPRFTLLWEREGREFRLLLLAWLTREAAQSDRGTPAHFEVGFGMPHSDPSEPSRAAPIEIDLGEGRLLRVKGKIDRIDRRPDGSLVLRDYKTGRAPRDDGRFFNAGKQLQMPFYVLAAESLFPGNPVSEAFLDYVDGGRRVSLDLERVRGEGFRSLLVGIASAMSAGVFAQDPTACEWCDYTAVCGPRGLLHARRQMKRSDRLLVQLDSLRGLG
jgi:ATP-dependent helicase/DNAse subunit B